MTQVRPFEIWQYAALAEQVYRRADTDQLAKANVLNSPHIGLWAYCSK